MNALTTFTDVKLYLERFHDHSRTKYTLDNMLALMEYFRHPEDKFKTVHVAGTSGKTSTSYFMSSLLTASGKKTGLTVSPHINEINERVQINGRPLPEAEFCAAITEFLNIIDEAPVQPSWFEAVVAFAYWYFAREKVDYAVVEVGLGGLKDGTNVINRPEKVCILTDIGLDHVNVLGSNLTEIAAQKAGIIQDGNAVFTYRQPAEVMEVYDQVIGQKQATITVVEDLNSDVMPPDLPDFQKRNWNLAYAVYQYLQQRDGLKQLAAQEILQSQHTPIPGRMDALQIGGKLVIMDGAHNEQKMSAFVNSFMHLYPGERPAVLIAIKEGKDDQAVAPLVGPLASRIVTTTFEAKQDLPFISMDPGVLADALRPYNSDINSVPNQYHALMQVLAGPEKIVIITGSFYLISQVKNDHLKGDMSALLPAQA